MTLNLDEKLIRSHYSDLTRRLIEKKLTITTMESATSGQIASLITDTEGASAIIKGAYVTYSNEAKIAAGVNPDIIEKYSVYSKETAFAMAKAAKEAFKADISIGVTGTMGNVDPNNADSSVPGQVFFSIVIADKSYTYSCEVAPQPSRLMYKLAVAELIYQNLWEHLF